MQNIPDDHHVLSANIPQYLNKKDISLIFETADHFKEVINRSIKKVPTLRDITIANIFFENSTRTRLSFELAEKRLSADVVNFSAGQSSVKKGETLIDTVNNIDILFPTSDLHLTRSLLFICLLNILYPPHHFLPTSPLLFLRLWHLPVGPYMWAEWANVY